MSLMEVDRRPWAATRSLKSCGLEAAFSAGPGDHGPRLRLLMGWEEVEYAVDGLGGIDGVHGGQDQVTSLSG